MKNAVAMPETLPTEAGAVQSAPAIFFKGLQLQLNRIECKLDRLLWLTQHTEQEQYNQAIAALAHGNKQPLNDFLRSGGKIPNGD